MRSWLFEGSGDNNSEADGFICAPESPWRGLKLLTDVNNTWLPLHVTCK